MLATWNYHNIVNYTYSKKYSKISKLDQFSFSSPNFILEIL